MQNYEFNKLVSDLITLKRSILQFNDFLLLNMESSVYNKISISLLNRVEKINNIIEKMNKLDVLVSETNMTAKM